MQGEAPLHSSGTVLDLKLLSRRNCPSLHTGDPPATVAAAVGSLVHVRLDNERLTGETALVKGTVQASQVCSDLQQSATLLLYKIHWWFCCAQPECNSSGDASALPFTLALHVASCPQWLTRSMLLYPAVACMLHKDDQLMTADMLVCCNALF